MSVIWHDLECGSYAEDLDLWRALARRYGDPILDVGAGTGRVTLDLAREGHRVTALDCNGELLVTLGQRAAGGKVRTCLADAREFELEERFALCIVPMQTIQLLGGGEGRLAFLSCARRHIVEPGALAIAISSQLETFEVGDPAAMPLPDVAEIDGVVYASHPIAVRDRNGGFELVRRRERVATDGSRAEWEDCVALDGLSAAQLESEAARVGLHPISRVEVPPTPDYVGSTVVVLGG